MLNRQIICDFCKATIKGVDDTKRITKNYISTKGLVYNNVWNEELKRHIFVRVCQEDSSCAFCNIQCLEGFITERTSQQYDKLVGGIKNKEGYTSSDYLNNL